MLNLTKSGSSSPALPYISRIFDQMRRRSDIAVRSLCDFYTKNCIVYGDILVTSLGCRIWVADNPLGDFYIKITF